MSDRVCYTAIFVGFVLVIWIYYSMMWKQQALINSVLRNIKKDDEDDEKEKD